MSANGILRFLGLKRDTQPAHERALQRAIADYDLHRIVEIGTGNGERAVSLIQIAKKNHDPGQIRYTGIDLFESRPQATSEYALKAVHRRLAATQIAVRLVPGDAATALPRCANDLRGTDLVLVAGDQDPESLERAWHFLPRMLHARSQVWIENREQTNFQQLTAKQIGERITQRGRRRAA